MTLRYRLGVGIAIILMAISLDQASKYYVLTELMNPPQIIPITSFFNLVLAWNTGVSFSLFNSYGLTGMYVLTVMACTISVGFFIWMLRAQNHWLVVGLALIVGGAVGNVIDRIRFGAVIDFLHFYYHSFSWPAFNLADTFITIGVVCILIESLITRKGEQRA
jgi:signal peptidase II